MNPTFKATQLKELSSLLSDGQWHSSQELAEKMSWRFGSAIYQLRKQGYQIEKHRTSDSNFSYRLLNPQTPTGEHVFSLDDLVTLAPFVAEQVPYLQLLILFGSRARDDSNKESDWDFAVLYDEILREEYEKNGWDWLRIWRILEDVFDLPEDKVDCIILNECSDIIAHTVARDGKLLYEKEKGAFESFQQRASKTNAELKVYRQTVREKVRSALKRWKA